MENDKKIKRGDEVITVAGCRCNGPPGIMVVEKTGNRWRQYEAAVCRKPDGNLSTFLVKNLRKVDLDMLSHEEAKAMTDDIGHGQGIYNPEDTQMTCEELLAGSNETISWYMQYCYVLEDALRKYYELGSRASSGIVGRITASNDLAADGGMIASKALNWPESEAGRKTGGE